ncbi:class I SAM-dependent methyltransferase [Ornithinimicrobium faecis]|uniref:class I SAM-dependent methyltransferase n=1 Tax=Ornithinimicrobium faecis TaxID=2934158 RepID=UPI002119147F|nr:class I SAM-dependent methyltransferase [Ornithinimicrobium sp. HY1745]
MSDADYLRATRESYDRLAEGYATQFYAELDTMVLERALLGAFAEEVADGAPVLDVGCGPGRTTAYLAERDLSVTGLDLSPEMVRLARDRHPDLSFAVGSMTDLPVPDGTLGGLLAFYSLIHVPTADVPLVLAEWRRALRPGAPVAIAFQVGSEVRKVREHAGQNVDLDFHRRHPEQLAQLLAEAGFSLWSTTVQPPAEPGKTPHAFILARSAG